MRRKQKILKIATFYLICCIVLFFLLDLVINPNPRVSLNVGLLGQQKDTIQVYYKTENEKDFKEQLSVKQELQNPNKLEKLKFVLNASIDNLRLDLGSRPGQISIENVEIKSLYKSYSINLNQNLLEGSHDINKILMRKSLIVDINGNDPYILFNINSEIAKKIVMDNQIFKLFIITLITLILSFLFLKIVIIRRKIANHFTELISNKTLIFNLAKNDFKTKFAGSFFGITWAFVQPVVTVMVYWFVFQVGFKAGTIQDVPFILWLVAGIIPWFFFSEGIMGSTYSMLEYSYLVKKVLFQINILPIVKILSSFFVHIFFVLFAILIYGLYGYAPTIYTIQVIYYSFCTFMFIMCLSLFTSAIIIFFKDLGQLINLFLQIGMWLTPIMWSFTMVPAKYNWILKINPMYYIVEGYRDSFIKHVWFWHRYNQSIYFWIIIIAIFFCSSKIFKKLKPHFADVL